MRRCMLVGPRAIFYFPPTIHIWQAFPYPPLGDAFKWGYMLPEGDLMLFIKFVLHGRKNTFSCPRFQKQLWIKKISYRLFSIIAFEKALMRMYSSDLGKQILKNRFCPRSYRFMTNLHFTKSGPN